MNQVLFEKVKEIVISKMKKENSDEKNIEMLEGNFEYIYAEVTKGDRLDNPEEILARCVMSLMDLVLYSCNDCGDIFSPKDLICSECGSEDVDVITQ